MFYKKSFDDEEIEYKNPEKNKTSLVLTVGNNKIEILQKLDGNVLII